jgi:hypothetical protein
MTPPEMRLLDPRGVALPELLDSDGKFILRPAAYFDGLEPNALTIWCLKHARYGVPTRELVDWLAERIAGRKAIEIGAGAGDLCHHLGVPGTDSYLQDKPELRLYYAAFGQRTVSYAPWVERLDAAEAIATHRPQVVIGSWITQLWKSPADTKASVYGVDEEAILDAGLTYITIGNRRVHDDKRILRRPHQEHIFLGGALRSRGLHPEDDRVWEWRP